MADPMAGKQSTLRCRSVLRQTIDRPSQLCRRGGSVCCGLVRVWKVAVVLVAFGCCDVMVAPLNSLLGTRLASSLAIAQDREQESAAQRDTSKDSPRRRSRGDNDLTFDDLKFDMEQGEKFERSMLTEDIEDLHKQKIKIRGYILPTSVFKQSGIQEFVLVRDNMECCFGPGAMLYDCIMVQMEKGKTTDFSTRPVAVEGKFQIKEFLYPDSDEHYAIYRMIATSVK